MVEAASRAVWALIALLLLIPGAFYATMWAMAKFAPKVAAPWPIVAAAAASLIVLYWCFKGK